MTTIIDRSEEAGLDAVQRGLNGTGPVEGAVLPPVQDDGAREAAIRQGVAEYHAIRSERDYYKKKFEDERIANAELHIAIDQAREHERLKVQTVVNESIEAGKRAEAERDVLLRDNADLRQRIVAGEARVLELLSQLEGHKAFVATIEAACQTVLKAKPADGSSQ